jgi:hypothetical protein
MTTLLRLMTASTPMAVLGVTALLVGCESYFNHAGPDAGGDTTGAAQFAGTGLGGKCKLDDDCRQGLRCTSGVCQATGTSKANDACLLSAECGTGLHCGWSGFCTPQPAGTVAAGQGCQKSGDCAAGLFCALKPANQCPGGGTCGSCTAPTATVKAPEGEECTASSSCPPGMACDLLGLTGTCKQPTGTGDLGVKCAQTKDCLSGLVCSATSQTCVAGSLLLEPDLFGGVECDDLGEAKRPFEGVFQLPRGNTETEFYALPFPSDVRTKSGRVDLAGHPHPGLGLLGFDTVQSTMTALGQEMQGWGLSSTMYLRFTRALDPATLTTGPGGNVRLVDLTTGADLAVNVKFFAPRNKYICGNRLYAHTPWNVLLEPGHTYALVVTDGVGLAKGAKGTAPASASADFALMLADAAPGQADEAKAWTAHAPLRAWLKKGNLGSKKPVTAAVFTTWEPRQSMQDLVAVAQTAADAPKLVGPPIVCGPGVHDTGCGTPNWDAKLGLDPRDCPQTEFPAYREVHAQVRLPMFQNGERPYLKSGGGLNVVNGKPAVVGYETVCVAFTIPKTPMPAGGYPVVLFAHGTGGSFRSVGDGTAGALATGLLPNGQKVADMAIAGLGFDQPMHGPRRGTDPATKQQVTTDPGPLFYNFANPPAARGNFYQGAIDNVGLLRLAVASQKAPLDLGKAGLVKFDPAALMFMGHSQGGTTGPMFLPYVTGLKAAVLSGCGGSLVYGLLGKKKPYDALLGLQIALQDAQVDEYHPVLALLQFYFEASDPLLYAPLYFSKPAAPFSVLHTFGQGDSFTPPTTSKVFAAAMRGDLFSGGLDPVNDAVFASPGLKSVSADIAGNVMGGKATGATIQAANVAAKSLFGAAYDGHFVAFNDKDTVRRVLVFLASAVKGTPKVPL